MLHLIRHGEEDQTVRGGWSRTALTDTGIVQAERKFPGLYYRMLAWDEAYPNSESPHAFLTGSHLGGTIAWKAFKLPRVEPNMPKTRRHGGLSLFHPWQALACLRAQNENPIPAAIVFRCAAVFSERIFVRARHKSVRILTYFKLFNAARAGSIR